MAMKSNERSNSSDFSHKVDFEKDKLRSASVKY